jgi:hypothetical protein
VLLSGAQWCFSDCGEAIMSNEMTESDSERGKMGSSLWKIGHTITEIVVTFQKWLVTSRKL